MTTLWLILGALLTVALAGVLLGIRLSSVPEASQRVVAFSGGLLAGIALFWIVPEIIDSSGWRIGLLGTAAAFAGLWLLEHRLYGGSLHGIAGPLIAAASVHSFFDGWSMAVAQSQSRQDLQFIVLIGLALHKLPEGIALGSLLRAATNSNAKAALGSLAAQFCMFVGAGVAALIAATLAGPGSSLLLAVAAGVFAYLGFHAVEGQWRARGPRSALAPALAGLAGAAALRVIPGL